MDRAVRLPGLRALDRNFDRLPESMRWMVERLVHDPGKGAAPKPQLDPELRSRLERLLADDVADSSASRAARSAGSAERGRRREAQARTVARTVRRDGLI